MGEVAQFPSGSAQRVSVQTPVEISGAGPAGLAAALTITLRGGKARVYEQRRDVGARFHGDFQGLENWTSERDVLDELTGYGIALDFEYSSFYELTCFDPDGRAKTFRSVRPLFYLVRRGHEPGTLDQSLKRQALSAGVELRLNEPRSHLPKGGIVTGGPRRADAIASGLLFTTDMADGAYAAASDNLAPKGYAYLLVQGGRGTLSTCLFSDFHGERVYRERCVDFFTEHVGLRMREIRPFGGIGNFFLPRSVINRGTLYAGEAAGLQDPLFGFGMRWAIGSGVCAGRALVSGDLSEYRRFWRRQCRAYHETAVTNRWFYERMGNRGYRALLRCLDVQDDPRGWLQRRYRPRLWKQAWYRWAAHRRFPTLEIAKPGCDCTWCRCDRHRSGNEQSQRVAPELVGGE